MKQKTRKKLTGMLLLAMLGGCLHVTAQTESVTATCPDENHPHLIDLGLPSGTKWACCNVGASAPEQYGKYYAWGETDPKSVYDLETYKHHDGSDYADLGSDIAGTTYDAATANWKAPWRLPTLKQVKELLNNCTHTYTTQNDVKGRLFVGPNGATIFIPAAGYRWDEGIDVAGSVGYYWTSSVDASDPDYACYLSFGSATAYWGTSGDRYNGYTVRPVQNLPKE